MKISEAIESVGRPLDIVCIRDPFSPTNIEGCWKKECTSWRISFSVNKIVESDYSLYSLRVWGQDKPVNGSIFIISAFFGFQEQETHFECLYKANQKPR